MKRRRIKVIFLLMCFLFILFSLFGRNIFLAKAVEDTTAPQLTTFAIAPTSITTEAADQTLTLTVTMTDDLIGVCITGDCGSFSGSVTQLVMVPALGGSQTLTFIDFTRTAGDDNNGTYTADAIMPAGSTTGNWIVSSFLLVDKLGNNRTLDIDDVSAIPGASGMTVNNTATHSDVTAPQLTAFAIAPTSISTESADQTLTLTVTMADDQAGVCITGDCGLFSGSVTQLVMVPALGGSQTLTFIDFTRTSGDDNDGVYTADAVMPVGSTNDNWTVSSFLLVDKLGNIGTLDFDDVSAIPGASGVTINNTAEHADTTAPQLTTFTIAPTSITTEAADQTLTLTVTMTDDQAGVCITGDCGLFSGSVTQLPVTPAIGTQTVTFINFVRSSGNDLSGVYTATANIPTSSKEGLWVADGFLLTDKLGNVRTLNSDQLNAIEGSAGVTITNTANASTVTIEKEWTISSATSSVTFPVNTVVTKDDDGSFAFYQMVAQTFEITDLTQEGLTGRDVATLRMGIPGLNLNFSLPITLSFTVGTAYNGATLKIKSLGENSSSWLDEKTCVVSSGICSFTVDHATYFVAVDERTHGSSVDANPNSNLSVPLTLLPQTGAENIFY